MKRFLLAITVALAALSVYAGAKIDMQGQRMIKNLAKNVKTCTIGDNTPRLIESTLTIVEFTDKSVLNEIESLGATVRDIRNTMAIVEMPVAKMQTISELAKVKFISTPKKMKIKNDEARLASHVDQVRAGIPNPVNPSETLYFDGTGVVTGIMDSGLDPNHMAFQNSDGTSRVKGISVFSGSNGSVTRYTTATDIANFTTENEDETHGTHVLGMMAGSYKGGDEDWSGVATGSDIYVSCGDLYDLNILLGVVDVCDYAESVGKPAVVNLSLGGNNGSHDEYDAMCQYIDQIVNSYTPVPIVSIAAGNEGDESIAIVKEFTQGNTSFSTTIAYYSSSYPYVIATTEFYGDDDTPFTVTPFVYNTRRKQIVANVTGASISSSTGGQTLEYTCSDLGISSYFSDSYISQIGYPISVASDINADTGRYGVVFSTGLVGSSQYVIGYKVEGTAGHKIFCYHTDMNYGTTFSNANNSSFTSATADGTINSMACGRRTVVVGSYNTKQYWTSIDGNEYGYSYPEFAPGLISSFSSWGTLWDGREMPHFVAPGCVIASTVSTYNVTSQNGYALEEALVTRKITANGRDNYWGMMQGTSMATPHTSGIFALWKQALPDLSPEDACRIAQETAQTDQYTGTIQSGAGKIDAYAGLLHLIQQTSIESNIDRKLPTVLVVRNADGSYSLSAAEGADFNAKVYNLAGAEVASVNSVAGRATVNANRLAKGIYLISVNGARFSHSQKIVVK
ncbi:MAG: S8 family peptidase [Muribaculaceae bacterium]|nr:S8 family peptidase [Muribaculaceae bacterium]